MRVSGTWPGMLTFRQHWSKATARPWNESLPGASLRLERGSSGFLSDAASHLLDLGAEWVASPPLDPPTSRAWEEAGFGPFLHLDLYGRLLSDPIEEPSREVETGTPSDFGVAAEIDRLAFDETWQLGSLGLTEAKTATSRSAFLVSREHGRVQGFAITGVMGSSGYLQRLAVRPGAGGRGHGRSLLRASLQWCAHRGAIQQLLNTQPGNQRAAHLYLSEGYSAQPAALRVLRFAG